MTKLDDRALMWWFRECWGVPAEIAGSLSEEENLEYGKALLIAANGDGKITDAERDWILGYASISGCSPENIEILSAYRGEDDFEDLFTRGAQQGAQRVCICDAIRACGSDGELASEEVAAVHKMAERLSVPASVVNEYVEIYKAEQALKARRIGLAFPNASGS
ncbi:MAG: hypothetical protein M3083_21810 [Actinomycetota bacterium]|nr:hypothetical protein [Actinomycetota bacterium]MDQ6947794.1 hypothetical protein [Actinomycetota bacterium]